MFAWNPWALPGFLACAADWILAVVVYRARPDRSQNRRLAILLAVEGSWLGTELGLAFLAADFRAAYASTAVGGALLLALPSAYLAFLGTLDSPLARPFRGPFAGAALFTTGIGGALLFLGSRDRFVPGFTALPTWPYAWVPGPWLGYFNILVAVLLTYALAVAFTAWRRQPVGSPRRKAARAYLLATGIRDTWIVLAAAGFAASILWGANLFGAAEFVQVAVVYLLSALLLSYGVLSTQLFDIEFKVKLAVEKSTIVAAFALAFLVVSEVVERSLGVQGEIFGIAAAVAVGLVFRRVERVAGRLANRLMPGVEDTQTYRTVRKHEVYRAAVESALQDGEITERERNVLATVAEHMGLSTADARRIEQEVEPVAPR